MTTLANIVVADLNAPDKETWFLVNNDNYPDNTIEKTLKQIDNLIKQNNLECNANTVTTWFPLLDLTPDNLSLITKTKETLSHTPNNSDPTKPLSNKPLHCQHSNGPNHNIHDIYAITTGIKMEWTRFHSSKKEDITNQLINQARDFLAGRRNFTEPFTYPNNRILATCSVNDIQRLCMLCHNKQMNHEELTTFIKNHHIDNLMIENILLDELADFYGISYQHKNN